MLNGIINLRSDTQTLPTEEMLEAMVKAPLGDDVYQEDPTVRQLEELAASVVGKEDALFVPSGTMGNLIALKVHTHSGEEVILEKDAHIYYYEAGGLAAVCGLTPRLIAGRHGVMDPADVEQALRPSNIHYPPTSLLCYENTHNRAGGTVVDVETSKALFETAKRHGLAVHLDGARIFNAALYLGVDARVLASYADSVMFCLSKGLSAPVGSVLTGTREFIKRARHVRKMLGGGMRQAGVLAAAGIIAITKMRDRLREDHENARRLALGVARIPGLSVDLGTVQTNMVNVLIDPELMSLDEFVKKLESRRVLVSTRPPHGIRMVTHRHITADDVDTALGVIREVVSGK
ncbi:MAG TPA: aminotransferase class I/II-fold pyridoxal phosphate-dependent enzyme [Firmicutes bacterium]|nr:aminotransferase class I/II-fold pyridoxal phosphate-dependent enzyme [Bacillota bacterium]